MSETEGKMVQTNMGPMPLEDYLDIVASQYGYDSYEEMQAEGYKIDTSRL